MATNDVVTDAEARLYVKLKATDTSDKATLFLPALVTAVSTRLDECVGPIIRRTVTGEAHDGGDPTIELRRFPVVSYTSVTEYYAGTQQQTLTRETIGTIPSAGYYAEPYEPDPTLFNGILHRRSNGFDARFATGRGNIAVTYVAGRFADTASVENRYKIAAGIMLNYLWQLEGLSLAQVGEYEVPQLNFPKFAVPNAVRDLLGDVWQQSPSFA